jgi:hypothetical protein
VSEQPKAAEQHRERRISSPEHRQAYEDAKSAPTMHKPRLITSRSVHGQVHGFGAIGRFNTKLAVVITKSVGTMWAAYVFSVIGITSLVGAFTGNASLALIAGGISSYFLQLVLLPVIIVGQNVISASQDARAEADHLTLTTLHAINVQQLQMLQQQRDMLQQQGKVLEQQQAILELLKTKGLGVPGTGS